MPYDSMTVIVSYIPYYCLYLKYKYLFKMRKYIYAISARKFDYPTLIPPGLPELENKLSTHKTFRPGLILTDAKWKAEKK